MKKVFIFAFMFLFAVSAAFAVQAAESGKKASSSAQLSQQDKMKTCNTEAKAKSLKGDERSKFMSECLKGEKSTATTPAATVSSSAPKTQHEKLKSCNAQAKARALKGEKHKKFMNDCLNAN